MVGSIGRVGRGIGRVGAVAPRGRFAAPAPKIPTAATYYVSGAGASSLPVGSNSNPGTEAAPFATLGYALSMVPAGGDVRIRCDGTFAENTASGRWVWSGVFAAPVLFESYTGDASKFVVTNVSGTSGVAVIRNANAKNIQFQSATLRSATDGNYVVGCGPNTSPLTAGGIALFDQIIEARTDATARAPVILNGDNGLDGLTLVRCGFKRTAGANTTANPLILSTVSLTQSIDNQPNANVSLYDCYTTDGQWSAFATNCAGINTLKIVRCNFTAANHALLIGVDNSTATVPKTTNAVVYGGTFTATGANAHGLLVGSNVQSAVVEGAEVNSVLQGLVAKGSLNVQAILNDVTVTAPGSVGNGLYAKASVGTVFSDSSVRVTGAAASVAGFREGDDNGKKAANTTLLRNVIEVSGSASAIQWGGASVSDGGAVSDYNTYILKDGATLGSVRGVTVSTLAELQAAWASNGLPGDNPLNDAHSTVVFA